MGGFGPLASGKGFAVTLIYRDWRLLQQVVIHYSSRKEISRYENQDGTSAELCYSRIFLINLVSCFYFFFVIV